MDYISYVPETGHKRGKITGEWRKPHNAENLSKSPQFANNIKYCIHLDTQLVRTP